MQARHMADESMRILSMPRWCSVRCNCRARHDALLRQGGRSPHATGHARGCWCLSDAPRAASASSTGWPTRPELQGWETRWPSGERVPPRAPGAASQLPQWTACGTLGAATLFQLAAGASRRAARSCRLARTPHRRPYTPTARRRPPTCATFAPCNCGPALHAPCGRQRTCLRP